MKDRILFILVLIGLAWGIRKWRRTKNERFLYSTLVVVSLWLHQYPFWLPLDFTLSFWGFLGFGVLLYKIMYKKLDKSLIVFAIVLLAFGIVFLLQGLLLPMYPSAHAKAWDLVRP